MTSIVVPTTKLKNIMEDDCYGNRLNDSNNGFWDREPEERAERMRSAAERGGVENFFDLAPEERAQAYDA